MTVISGPHVHKKSRKQYTIFSYTSILPINISSHLSFHNFLLFKQDLLNHSISMNNDAFLFSFKYDYLESITL